MTSESKDKYVHAGKLDEAARLEAQARAFSRTLEKEFQILGLKSCMKVLDAGWDRVYRKHGRLDSVIRLISALFLQVTLATRFRALHF